MTPPVFLDPAELEQKYRLEGIRVVFFREEMNRLQKKTEGEN